MSRSAGRDPSQVADVSGVIRGFSYLCHSGHPFPRILMDYRRFSLPENRRTIAILEGIGAGANTATASHGRSENSGGCRLASNTSGDHSYHFHGNAHRYRGCSSNGFCGYLCGFISCNFAADLRNMAHICATGSSATILSNQRFLS